MTDEPVYNSLSGFWTGVYDYVEDPFANPDGMAPPTSFNVIIEDDGGLLSGEIIEPNTFSPDAGEYLYASLSGSWMGLSVSFVKSYEDVSEAGHEIVYEGVINEELTAIEGTWTTLEGEDSWSGPFVMNRQKPKTEEVAARREETVKI